MCQKQNLSHVNTISLLVCVSYIMHYHYKVMDGSSGGKMIVNSGKWPCGVCGKGVQANSIQCTVC